MVIYTALSPHPPLIVPEIGGERIKNVAATVRGMQQIAREIAALKPDTVIFLTPHGNVFSDCITCLSEPQLYGDFRQFGHHGTGTSVKNDLNLLKEIAMRATEENIDFITIDEEIGSRHNLNPRLDHGILVPLYYLKEAGLKDTAIVAISIGYLPILTLYQFGSLISQAVEKLGRKVVVIASGDMSHRLKDEGSYDYHPDGHRFDSEIKEFLQTGDVMSILEMPEGLRENAGECGYRSLVIMLGILDGRSFIPRVYSYEGTFGVGYLTAGFTPGDKTDSILIRMREKKDKELQEKRKNESYPVKWARIVLEEYVKNACSPILPPELEELKSERAAAFVSIKKHGQLRGCIGTIVPVKDNLAEEIAQNAISAGTKDPRFLPVEEGELKDLVYSVDILGEAEDCCREDLDPQRYGVIVSSGHRRGLLLPDLEGIDTVEKQLSIALKKASIEPHEPYKIQRFEVKRYT